MRDYGKVHTSFWSSANIRALTDDGRLLATYLMTSPHSTIAGVFRLPDGYVCEDMNWTPERVQQAFSELLANGFANRCGTTKWVWVIKHLDWNPPENPNQRKSALKISQSIPQECGWKREFMRVCGPLLGAEHLAESNPSPTVAKPFPNQEQEQKQEQKQEKKDSAVALLLSKEIPEPLARDFLAIRKAKKAPLTETALAGIEKEAGKAGYTLQKALETCCSRGWQGFEAKWVLDKADVARVTVPGPTGPDPELERLKAHKGAPPSLETLAAMAEARKKFAAAAHQKGQH
jgi:hypothetical protein